MENLKTCPNCDGSGSDATEVFGGLRCQTCGGSGKVKETNLELLWLRWFYQKADFGPAHGDVIDSLKKEYVAEGNRLPAGYEEES